MDCKEALEEISRNIPLDPSSQGKLIVMSMALRAILPEGEGIVIGIEDTEYVVVNAPINDDYDDFEVIVMLKSDIPGLSGFEIGETFSMFGDEDGECTCPECPECQKLLDQGGTPGVPEGRKYPRGWN